MKKIICHVMILVFLIQPCLAAKRMTYRTSVGNETAVKNPAIKKAVAKSPIVKKQTSRFASLKNKLYPIVVKNYGSKAFKNRRIGISFKDVKTGYRVSINGEKAFPAASIIKLPVMAYLFYMSDKHLINLNERQKFTNSDKLPGAGVLQWMRPTSYTLWNLCRLMISISDNSATRLLVNRLGKTNINVYALNIGLNITRVRDATALKESPNNRINLTTPNDISYLLYRIEKKIGFSSSSRKDMLSFMFNQKYRFGVPRVLPRNFKCANKTGNLTYVLHDAAIVYSPKGAYVLCVFTKGFKRNRDARIVINKISEIVAEYYK